MRFYIPPNLQRDFTDSIAALGTDCIKNFVIGSNVRVRMDKVNYRTKDGVVGSDEVFFAEISSDLKMGDYLQYNEEILLINQVKTNKFPACYELSAGTCNTKLDITRYFAEEMNEFGVITKAAGDKSVVKSLYCMSVMGSFEFGINNGSPGIIPSDVMISSCQVNTATKSIKEGDNFVWYGDKYQVQSIDVSQVDLDGLDGILSFHSKKVI